MNIIEEKKDAGVVFKLEGRLDSASAPEAEKRIIDAIEGGTLHVILNFSGLEYLSSAGIRVLVLCHKKLQSKKGEVILAALPKQIENVLYITGFLPYFKIFETEELALQNFNQ